jgi:hypothetical protein
MMPLKVNADYEVELFHNKIAPPAINQSIEFLLFFLNSNPLYSQKKYSEDYLRHIAELTGRTPSIVAQGKFENFWGPLKNKEIEKWWNSKLTSTELIMSKGWCADTHIIKNEDDLKSVNWKKDLLLKDPFGMSGQKFQQLRQAMTLQEREATVLKAIAQGPVILEPWFNRKFDFSQYLFPNGKLIAYQNQVDGKFQYKGTIFQNCISADLRDLSFYSQITEEKWASFRSQTQEVIDFYSQHPNECGFSIDSFVYEEDGELKIRVMSEINYRRTMGRAAYELSGKFSADKSWTALLLAKVSAGKPLWKLTSGIEGVMVLSPGDSRFEIIFLAAKNQEEGLGLVERINVLLPDSQFTVEL